MDLRDILAKLESSVNNIEDKLVAAESPNKPKKEPEPSPYEIRREDAIENTVDFARDAFDSLLNSMDSISIFKNRLQNISKQEALRINPDATQSLIGLASQLEKVLESAYDQAEDLMIAVESDRL